MKFFWCSNYGHLILLFNCFLCTLHHTTKAQENNHFSVSAYLDVYYAFDFDAPTDQLRQPFLFNHNRHNQFQLNLGMANFHYKTERLHAKFSIMSGNYAEDNLAHEPVLLRYIYEANVQFDLNKSGDTKLLVGIFPSHIGFESAIADQNITYTRSLVAENSPYYLSGLWLSHQINNWNFGFIINNGWQVINRPLGAEGIAFGTQTVYDAGKRWKLSWNTYIDPWFYLSFNQSTFRFYNNLYAISKWNDSFQTIFGFDIGLQEQNGRVANWYTPTVIVQYELNDQWKLGARVEYYHDPDLLEINSPAPPDFNHFSLFGGSINLDRQLWSQLSWRTEARYMRDQQPIFYNTNTNLFTHQNFILISGVTINLQ